MSDVDCWDDEDFDPEAGQPKTVATTNQEKWSGEDEDDELKDNWDEEEKAAGPTTTVVQVKKKKKNLNEIMAEKEEKKRREQEEKRKKDEEARRKMSPEEMMADKLRKQQIQEDADLELAKETFGGGDTPPPPLPPATGRIDTYEPITKPDFDTFSGLIRDKLIQSQRSTHYVEFLETLFRDLTVELDVDEIKRLTSSMTALYNEKNKAQKNAKGKKKGKGGKVSLHAGKSDNYEDYQAGGLDEEYDDFI